MSHSAMQRSTALMHADFLVNSIKLGRMNPSAFEAVMRSYLDQPAYGDRQRQDYLLELAMERLNGRARVSGDPCEIKAAVQRMSMPDECDWEK